MSEKRKDRFRQLLAEGVAKRVPPSAPAIAPAAWSEVQLIVSLAYAGAELVESAAGRTNDRDTLANIAYHAADILTVIKQRAEALARTLEDARD